MGEQEHPERVPRQEQAPGLVPASAGGEKEDRGSLKRCDGKLELDTHIL
jgi:hypothetical protein